LPWNTPQLANALSREAGSCMGALWPELAGERTRFARGGGVDVEVDAQLMHFI
jgi:hypothetical protein